MTDNPTEARACGSFGCTLPAGHNRGQADIPDNHAPAVQSDPAPFVPSDAATAQAVIDKRLGLNADGSPLPAPAVPDEEALATERTTCDHPDCPWFPGQHHPACVHDDHSTYGELFEDGGDWCLCGFSLGMDFPDVHERWVAHLVDVANSPLRARDAAQVAALRARVEAVLGEHYHADTCGSVLTPDAGYECTCWKRALRAALNPEEGQ